MKGIKENQELLKGIRGMHELGRQRALELGHPYYAKERGDDEFYTKETPEGDRFLVKIELIFDSNGYGIAINETLLHKKENE